MEVEVVTLIKMNSDSLFINFFICYVEDKLCENYFCDAMLGINPVMSINLFYNYFYDVMFGIISVISIFVMLCLG